jgi:N-acetylmuramoyl-L-alanine amidase-like protein
MAVAIVSRAQWSARTPEARRQIAIPTPRLWIHHSADSARGAAGMRSIQNFHMDTRGYADIGYSFLVDNADGTIFEGRGVGIQGAHTLGDNTKSHAICVMGNFENVQPSAQAIASIVALARHGREKGWWVPTCHGHREAPMASTACPGAHLFARLGEIRTQVGGPGIPGALPTPEEADVTEEELRPIIREEVASVLNKEAVKVFGVTSWENYLEAVLKAARQH